MMSKIKIIYSEHKPWFLILAAFIAARVLIFILFWRASLSRGIRTIFYNSVEQMPPIFAGKFHEFCDWHPPLYYAFCTIMLNIFHSLWFIYAVQMILAVIGLFLSYKIARLFFSKGVSYAAVFLLAIEPYWAWSNWVFFSENLSIPLYLSAIYYYLRFIKEGRTRFLYYAAAGLGLEALIRLNNLLLAPLLVVLALVIYLLKGRLKLSVLPAMNFKKLIVLSAIFLAIFGAILAPWVIRNKIVYDRYGMANVLYTNTYFYNVPILMSIKEGIPYSSALQYLIDKANADLGKNVGDKNDCAVFTKEQLNRQFDYYQAEARKYIFANFLLYAKIHLVRTAPFFLQSGNLDIYSALTGAAPKIDLTGSLMSGNFKAILAYFADWNMELILYLAGLFLWGLATLSLLFSLVYSFFKDRQKFVFFGIVWAILIYNALLISPFANVRYRLPVYIFFFVGFAYALPVLPDLFKKVITGGKRSIRRYPVLARLLKKTYDWRSERKTWKRIDQFLKMSELPFTKTPPPKYVVGHEPTIGCNLKCKMCYQGETRSLRQEQLSTDQILNIYVKLKGRVKEIKLVGGEPMIRPDILELIAFWDQAGARVILQSNCTLIGENNIEQLKNYAHLTDILTSLDGPEEVHDAIRGVPGTFNKLKKAVGLIEEKMPQVPITVFATLLINDNIDKFHELIDTAKSMGLGTINVLFEQVYSKEEIEAAKNKFRLWGWESGINYRLNTQERNPIFSADLDVAELKKKMSAIRNYGLRQDCFVNFTPFNFYRHLNQYLGREKIERVFCMKLLEPELRISQKGEVVWCDIIEKSFGNLLDKTPDEIWLSEDYQNFRKFLSQRSLPICSRCCKAFYYK